MNSNTTSQIRLRAVNRGDLPLLYEFNLDPDANTLAGTIARSIESFNANWDKVLADSNVTARMIEIGEQVVGTISCFQRDGENCVGYWLDKRFWGQGIASHALELLLNEVHTRPLHAQVAIGNQASLRILQKAGFTIQRIEMCEEDERYLAGEVIYLVLQ